MVVPTSIEAQFRRLDKHLKELKQFGGGAMSEDESIVAAEICNSCVLALDKAMNSVWQTKATKKEGKGKPNIYFPINMTSREKLAEKFRAYQMPNMENENPEIFQLIDSVQVYRGVKWLSALHKLAAIRHEEFPKIEKVKSSGIGFGRGQDLYIKSLVIDEKGQIDFQGYGLNRATGKIEPAIVEVVEEMRSVLKDIGIAPYSFCESSVTKVKSLISKLYRLL
ncbi:MAG: hypothetical protein KBT70_15295 [Roseovarius sp.]|uniref:hypothetical protein n=1 Tax=Roseovarius sp. TaxID=1486281 RepID=UPI001B6E04C4|nr:hypothetical protein [Roseovarius sp.]MBQ0751557.1 hypothetical protein [Roseovarius sp.]